MIAKSGLTPRAADLGYAPRYLGRFLASSFSRFDGESTLPPQAANASRSTAAFLPSLPLGNVFAL